MPLSTLPNSISNLSNLTVLDLSGNQLSTLADSISNLSNLTRLYLRENQLSTLADSISNLSNLTVLDLTVNQLSTLADFISNLSNLTVLYLSGNQLSTLPDSISNLSNLTRLDLSFNQIKKIPSWLAENKLEIQIENEYASNCINLFGNPIEEPPLEVVKQGNESIRNYYSQIATQGKDYLYEAKMLIVGEGGAGKTTLAHKIKDTDCPLPTIDDRTKGITINTHSFSVPAQNRTETRPFQLNVWDFGGQEIYHATHRFFLSRRSLYVLVADNREDNTDFNYWLNIIELFAGDSPIIIVLNEKDDVQRIINTSELRSRYPYSLKELLPVNFKTHEETDSEKRQVTGKKHTIECEISEEDVPLNLLLEGFELPHITEEHLDDKRINKPRANQYMKKIKIFLASSSELESDRKEFEIFINRKNKEYVKDSIFLELLLWEDFIDAMSATRLQDEYNKAVEGCDIFVSLFHTKVGKYTEEEFVKALETFKANDKPLIYTYFKDEAVNMSQITDKILTLINFKKKLSDLGHFYTNYADINDLKYKFGEQLIKVLPKLTGISATKIQQHSSNQAENLTKIEQHFHSSFRCLLRCTILGVG